MLVELKNIIAEHLNNKIQKDYNIESKIIVESPKDKSLGDVAIPSFSLCKLLHKSPMDIAPIIKGYLSELDYFSKIEIVGPYINCFYSREKISKLIIDSVENKKEKENLGTVIIEYSSPNIAKNFSIGHLRSSVIGQSLSNILEYKGYKVIRMNHLGDFGTQFGKLIYAFLNWSEEKDPTKISLEELVSLYVKFHEEAEKDPTLDDKGRLIFNQLESGNEEYIKLWSLFKDASLKEFKRIYDILGLHFDEYSSESASSKEAYNILNKIESLGLSEIDDGATIVRIGDDIPPAIIKRSDGSTLYITRDLQEVHRRYDKYHFDKALYVVGNEQKLYFNQVNRVLDRMNSKFKVNHIGFGMVLTNGKKMSTRSGNAIKLNDLIVESTSLALKYITEKNPNLENKEEIATAIGVSSVIFNDLKNYRENDYDFNLEDAVKFEGQTGPYLQYTSVRIGSILSQSTFDKQNVSYSYFNSDIFFDIVKMLDEYDEIINKCIDEYAPNYLAKYLLNLASEFNSFYSKEKCLVSDIIEKDTKLYLISLIKKRLDEGMKLLNMRLVEKM